LLASGAGGRRRSPGRFVVPALVVIVVDAVVVVVEIVTVGDLRSRQQCSSQVGQRDRRKPVFGDEGLEGGRNRTGGLLFVAKLDGAPDQVGQTACRRRPHASIGQHRVAEERSPGTMPERGGKEFMHVAAFDRTAGSRVEGLLRKVREFFQGHESSFGVPRRIGSDARV
jgi:hypothetical protein